MKREEESSPTQKVSDTLYPHTASILPKKPPNIATAYLQTPANTGLPFSVTQACLRKSFASGSFAFAATAASEALFAPLKQLLRFGHIDGDQAQGDTVSAVVSFACSANVNSAVFVSESALPASVETGQAFSASLTVANCTASTRNATDANAPNGYKLGFAAPKDAFPWDVGRIRLPEDVPPNSALTVAMNVVAGSQVGSFPWAWAVSTKVSNGSPAPAPCAP